MKISVENLTLSYGDSVAVRDLNVEIEEGEALVLLGQSGCGKTSTMRCIAGLETPDTGVIRVGDQVLFDSERRINKPSHKRNIGMVFQSYAIWPHMTVFENVAFPLSMQRLGKTEINRRVSETLELVGLEGFADRGASMLSGGQMQRVALARSVVMQPSVMLLDEPLSNLDARLRHRLRGDLRELQTRLGLTSIYVTHDQEEALALADHIAMMQFGRIVQVGTPDEIYSRPLSASIADFLGVGNILPVDAVDPDTVRLTGTDVLLQVPAYAHGVDLRACIRGEDILIGVDAESSSPNAITGQVITKEFQGATATYRIRLGNSVEVTVLGSKHRRLHQEMGDDVRILIPLEAIQVLPIEVGGGPQRTEPTSLIQAVA
ncbi:ABC transporter ATP-binding protein [Subtercola sp. RTI3]|uniref:ABC transporter ATP-binding protein n=1 Tax=Subtercola sp. RTI3 TaxID=3048639 RepID=UPI002B226C1D|nr:ABC transporter ATP-binding protein [Subtercola sp. RTI3]MEA9984251.1 ABC transporter ATP-binding protein [Subtercola sp. RTI3]